MFNIKFLTKNISLIALTLLMAACGTRPLQVKEEIPSSQDSRGLALVSVTVSGEGLRRFDRFWLRLRREGQSEVIEIAVKHGFLGIKPNLTDGGRVLAIPLPPGDYSIDGWRGHMNRRPAFTPKHEQTLTRFKIASGQKIYLGHVNFRIESFTHKDATITDEAERDLGIIQEQWKLSTSTIEKATVQ